MEKNIFEKAKNSFKESHLIDRFIDFESNILYFHTLEEILDKDFKIVLIYGEPGVGKTMVLKKLYHKYKNENNLYFYSRPFRSSTHLLETLSRDLYSLKEKNLYHYLEESKEIFPKNIILDEAQLYDIDILENIRLLADTNKLNFILSLHIEKEREIIAREHFKTRIFKTVKINKPSKNEFHIYLQKKLLLEQLFDLSKQLNKSTSDSIYKLTQGNLRECDKFMYTLFDILDYYHQTQPTKIKNNVFQKKFIEMTAISLGYIDA